MKGIILAGGAGSLLIPSRCVGLHPRWNGQPGFP